MKAIIISVNKREDNMHNPYKALWVVSIEDAQKICSDNRTRGQSHFLAYFILKDIQNYNHFKFIDDNGMYNEIIKDYDIKIFQSKKMGYETVQKRIN